MEEGNASGSNVGLNDGTICGSGSFFIRAINQDYHNVFPDIEYIMRGIDFLTVNPENQRALQKFTTADVLALQFDSSEAGESFYHIYASAVGFIVQEDDDTGRNEQGKGEVVMRRWVCNRDECFHQKKHLENVKDPAGSSTGVNCPAAFCVRVYRDSRKWLVREFVQEHTHELAPTCKSYVQIDLPPMILENEEKKGLVNAKAQLVGTGKQPMHTSGDGHCRAKITSSDVEIALDYLSAKKGKDNGLFYEAKTVEGSLTSLFWADTTAQLDNACFGDVVAVYRTSSHLMPFVILAGLNHHHQTCVFGCALLHDETTESYIWLFQRFLHVMHGCMPVSVVSDDHKAVCKAIKLVLPRSRIRLCTQHLENTARSIVNNPSFIFDFKACMLEVLTLHDFELKWKAMVDKHKVSEKPWIQSMHENLHMWAETYLRGHFWGGLKSTRVCDSINKHLSQFSQNQLKLHEFINLYNETVDEFRLEEAKAEHDSMYGRYNLSNSLVKIEKHAADVFTLESYRRFLSEMRLESLLFVENKVVGSNHTTYRLGNFKHENKNFPCEVKFKPIGPIIKCSCLKFETWGFPCSHAIHVIKAERLERIPQHLINPRWTKSAKSTAQFWQRSLPPLSSDIVTKMVHYGTLMSLYDMLVYLGSKPDKYDSVYSAVCKRANELMERSCARRARNKNGTKSMTTREKDGGVLVSRIARSKGGQFGAGGDKRRKTNGDDGRSRNVEGVQIKHGCLRLINALTGVAAGNSPIVMQDHQGRDSR